MKLSGLYLISFLLFLCGCSNETLLQEYDTKVPIRFVSECIQLKSGTTGVVPGNNLPPLSTISIFSLQHPVNESLNKWMPTLFNNTIGRPDSQGNIIYDNTYYFPAGEQLDFFATYPSLAEINSDYSDNELIDITLQPTAEDQVDLMYASLLNQSKKESLLIFNFHHLLTQITFNIIQGESCTIDLPLTKIEVVAPKNAILNLWNGELLPELDQTVSYSLTTHTQIEGITAIPGYFLLFPEKATEFVLTFGTDDSHIYHIASSDTPSTWKSGMSYQYNITINKSITDQIIPSINPNDPTDTEPADESTPSDTTESGTTENDANSDQTDSDTSSSTDESPTTEEETDTLPDTLPEEPADSTDSNDTSDKTINIQTKTNYHSTQEVVIIHLSLD